MFQTLATTASTGGYVAPWHLTPHFWALLMAHFKLDGEMISIVDTHAVGDLSVAAAFNDWHYQGFTSFLNARSPAQPLPILLASLTVVVHSYDLARTFTWLRVEAIATVLGLITRSNQSYWYPPQSFRHL